MSQGRQIRTFDSPFPLENGGELHPLQLAFHSSGTLNTERDNVILITHALTGSSDAFDWWEPVIGPGRAIDTSGYFVLCVNVLGSPYGSTSPLTYQDFGKSPAEFPKITIRDVVRSQRWLTDSLGITAIQSVIGGSLGGMTALEWGIMYPDLVKSIVSIGSSARHSAWCIGWSAAQRQAIRNDPAWNHGNYGKNPPKQGLALARQIAMISYRSMSSFSERFGRELQDGTADFYTVESYLDYQGKKLVERFDANCYIELTKIMDTHDVSRDRAPCPEVLESIRQPTQIISIDTDVLYVPAEQKELAEYIPHSECYEINSIHGHDAFLIEFEQVEEALRNFGERYWE